MPQQMLSNFVQGSGDLAFSCLNGVSRHSIAKELTQRTTDTFRINQGETPLCGPAAFMHCIATDRPADYVRYVLDLATTGTGTLGGLIVTPSDDCRDAALANKIDPVDWVALASLRDASNAFLDMNGPDSNAAGITVGSALAGWFSKTGWFPGGVSDSTSYGSQSFDHLLSINQRVNSHVCLFIRSAIISSGSSSNVGINKFNGSGTPKTWLGTPDHWVVLKNRLTIDHKAPPLPGMQRPEGLEGKRLDFTFVHWGQQSTPINSRIHNITPAKFLPYYYGYVSATR